MNQSFEARIQGFQSSFQQKMFLTTMASLFSICSVIVAGIECRRHPLYCRGMCGEIMQSWHYKMDSEGRQVWYKSTYQPRFVEYQLAPEKDPKSRKCVGLDALLPTQQLLEFQIFSHCSFNALQRHISSLPRITRWVEYLSSQAGNLKVGLDRPQEKQNRFR